MGTIFNCIPDEQRLPLKATRNSTDTDTAKIHTMYNVYQQRWWLCTASPWSVRYPNHEASNPLKLFLARMSLLP